VRLFARQLADPWWPWRHPILARQELQQGPSPAEDEESRRWQREANELQSRLEEELLATPGGPTSWSFHARSTFDGMRYEVAISPYTEEVAHRIRQAAAPTGVEVRRSDS
jgi:hypothetical protein